MRHPIRLTTEIPANLAGSRLDKALSSLFPEYSRSKLKTWIESGAVLVNHQSAQPRTKVLGLEQIEICADLEEAITWQAQPIALDIIYEDDSLLVINKPAGLVVHPAAGHREGTLVNALLHHAPELVTLPRGGLIHRLDKDTSGLLVIAKTLTAYTALVSALQKRRIKREYFALVSGELTAGGSVDQPMGRHPVQRKKRAIVANGKPAVTHYRVLQRFSGFTSLRVMLETGRTHQIRVHMAFIHHPLLGDPLYAGRPKLPKGASPDVIKALQQFKRQALHARLLGLIHPVSGEPMEWEAPLPEDLVEILRMLG